MPNTTLSPSSSSVRSPTQSQQLSHLSPSQHSSASYSPSHHSQHPQQRYPGLDSSQQSYVSDNSNATLAMIQKELAALQAAKKENEVALKEALLRKQGKSLQEQQKQQAQGKNTVNAPNLTSPLQKQSGLPSPLRGIDKLAWERAIIEDELSKPLEVSEEWIKSLTLKEQETEQLLFKGLNKHQESLSNLRTKLLEREVNAEKNFALRAAKEALGPRPETLEEFHRQQKEHQDNNNDNHSTSQGSLSFLQRASPSRQSTRSHTHTAALSSFTAAESHVLDSLARLEELESRITDLEEKALNLDVIKLLGLNIDSDTGGSNTNNNGNHTMDQNLRSAYAPMKFSGPSGSVSTKRNISPSRSIFSATSIGTMNQSKAGTAVTAGNLILPQVGFAPVLGVVYTKKRTQGTNGQPGKTMYTVERIEEATERKGIYLNQNNNNNYSYDYQNYQDQPLIGDTGGSISIGGRNHLSSSSMDGDDVELMKIAQSSSANQFSSSSSSNRINNVPVETSDAIDKWLASKQRQIANAVQAQEAENIIKNKYREARNTSVGSKEKSTSNGASIARGRAAPGQAKNTRLANSLPPVARGRPLLAQTQTTGNGNTFKRNAAKTVAVGTNISKVLAQERAKQAAKNQVHPHRPMNAGTARVERSSTRIAVNRATLGEFKDIRKKMDNQKLGNTVTRKSTTGPPSSSTTTTAGRRQLPSPSKGGITSPVSKGSSNLRSNSNPRGTKPVSNSTSTTRSLSNPPVARRSVGGPTNTKSSATAMNNTNNRGGGGGTTTKPTVTTKSTVPPKLGIIAPGKQSLLTNNNTISGSNKPASSTLVNKTTAKMVTSILNPPKPNDQLPIPRHNNKNTSSSNSNHNRTPFGGSTVQQARAKFGSNGVRMETLQTQGRR